MERNGVLETLIKKEMKQSMKRKWLECNQLCMAKGHSVALNLMFETKKDHQLFIKLWNRYMSEMAELINYQLSPTGWTLIFKTLSQEKITKAYHNQRKKSKKANSEYTIQSARKMLSEHFRILLSQFVKKSNKSSGRSGTKVKQRFEKYIIEDKHQYEKEFEKIMVNKHDNSQKEIRYQANEKLYDSSKEMSRDSIWKSGIRLYNGRKILIKVAKKMRFIDSDSYVLRHFLNNKANQLSKHFFP